MEPNTATVAWQPVVWKYLAIPGTSVPPKRQFSPAGQLASKLCSCTEPKHVDPSILPLYKAIASTGVIVSVSWSGGQKNFRSQLNNLKMVRDRSYVSMGC